jgi:hypothetical protein
LQCCSRLLHEYLSKANSTLEPVLDVVNPSVSAEDNINLLAPFTIDEFREALFSMKPDK